MEHFVYFVIDPKHGIVEESLKINRTECLISFCQLYIPPLVKVSAGTAKYLWEDFQEAGYKMEKINLKDIPVSKVGDYES